MTHAHAIVWIDSTHATVIDFSWDDEHVQHVGKMDNPDRRYLHDGSPQAVRVFHDDVVKAIGNAREVLIAGPGQAKHQLARDLEKRHPKVAKRVVAVEALDHPTDGQLLAHARKSFKRLDALLGDQP